MMSNHNSVSSPGEGVAQPATSPSNDPRERKEITAEFPGPTPRTCILHGGRSHPPLGSPCPLLVPRALEVRPRLRTALESQRQQPGEDRLRKARERAQFSVSLVHIHPAVYRVSAFPQQRYVVLNRGTVCHDLRNTSRVTHLTSLHCILHGSTRHRWWMSQARVHDRRRCVHHHFPLPNPVGYAHCCAVDDGRAK